jgi:hypothetical protein
MVRGINTTGSLQGETWADGDIIYLSPTVAGGITKVKPTAPDHSLQLGYVVYAHAVNGKIFVKVDNGYEIGELHDVYVPTPSNNDGIFWNTANLRYQNNSISGILGYTPQAALTLTTTGSSGAATLTGATLNIPQYSGTNIYNADGTLTGDRIVTSSGFGLTILGGKEEVIGFPAEQISLRLQGSSTDKNPYLSLKNINATGKDYALRSMTDGTFEIISYTDLSSIFKFNWTNNLFTFKINSTLTDGSNFNLGYNALVSGLWLSSSKVVGNYNLCQSGGDTFLNAPTGGKIGFRVSNADKMVLTNAGRLLLGTTTESTFLLDVNGTARVSGDAVINGLTVGKGTGSLTLNTALGFQALNANTTGNNNTAIGYAALQKNTTGGGNTAIGVGSSLNITTGGSNTSVGVNSCGNVTNGNNNTGVGYFALLANTTGNDNTAIGVSSLQSNINGIRNTSIGVSSSLNIVGSNNTSVGFESLRSSGAANGDSNTAVGRESLYNNSSGNNNTAIGRSSIADNSTGSDNTALGRDSLSKNTTGSQNVALGRFAGNKISGGVTDNAISNNSIYIGYDTRALASNQTNQIVIGYQETGLGSNTTIIGNSSTITTALRGRLLLGTTTDSGLYQLDVNGTARVSGGLKLNNAASTISWATTLVTGNNNILLYDGGSASTRIGMGAGTGTTTIFGYGGSTMRFGVGVDAASSTGFSFTLTSAAVTIANGIPLYLSSSTNSNAMLIYDGTTTSTRTGCGLTGGSNFGIFTYTLRNILFGAGRDASNLTESNAIFWMDGTNASVNIGAATNVASSILTLASTTKGFLPPRMTNAERTAIATPAVGLIVYCTDATEGLYIYKSTGWTFII